MDLSRLSALLRGVGAADLVVDPRGPGLPLRATRAEHRTSLALTALATALMLAVVTWELAGPVLAGHFASNASMGIIAENMERHRIAFPIWSYFDGPPRAADAYCHHPWGIFWTTFALFEVFGRHAFVCKLAAALLSVATPPLLYRAGAELHRPLAGACAAVAFVSTPIALAFAQFNALEVPVIAYGAWMVGSWARARRTDRLRDRVSTAIAAALAMLADWPGFVLVAALCLVELGSFASSRRSIGISRGERRRRIASAIVLGASGVAIAALFLAVFASFGKTHDLFASYEMRSKAKQATLAQKLDERSFWIELCFTPLGIAIGKAGAVVAAARFVVLRRAEELAPLAVLAMAVLQYVAFPQGADIHVFWPHHFALYLALAVASIAATIAAPMGHVFRSPRAFAATLAYVLVPLAIMMNDAMRVLAWARRTGGRFDEKGLFIETDGDKIALLERLDAELPRDAHLALHASFRPTWAHVFALGGRVARPTDASPVDDDTPDVSIADLRNLEPATAVRIFEDRHVRVFGPYLVTERGSGLEVSRFVAREPTLFERGLLSSHEPVWSHEPDPYGAWEIAFHYGLDPRVPRARPTTLEDLRIAYDIAVTERDEAGRAEAERALLAGLTVRAPIAFEGGHEVIGARLSEGAQPRVTLLVRAGGSIRRGAIPMIRGRVVAPPRGSTLPAAPSVRSVLPRPRIAPSLWRRGFIYSVEAALLDRPGTEVFEVGFEGPGAPKAEDGNRFVELFRR